MDIRHGRNVAAAGDVVLNYPPIDDEPRGFTAGEWLQIIAENERKGEPLMAVCEDCLRPYGDEHGFPDLVIPYWAWEKISTRHNDSGLLCPSCICARLSNAGIRCTGAFMSGPIISVSYHVMDLERRVENIELRCYKRSE